MSLGIIFIVAKLPRNKKTTKDSIDSVLQATLPSSTDMIRGAFLHLEIKGPIDPLVEEDDGAISWKFLCL